MTLRDEYRSATANIPSLYWGDEPYPGTPASGHNPMMDNKGRVWLTQVIRPGSDNPDWCKGGSAHPSATYFPIAQHMIRRQLSYYDPKSGTFTLIDTCYGTHHLQFAPDDTLWLSGDSNVIGWLDTKKYEQIGDERASQGWCPTVLDTNGDGKITKPWNEPGAPIDPTKDTRITSFNYGIIPNPNDGSIWVAGRQQLRSGRSVCLRRMCRHVSSGTRSSSRGKHHILVEGTFLVESDSANQARVRIHVPVSMSSAADVLVVGTMEGTCA